MDTIGKYEIRDRLGEGSTGTVYLAYDTFAHREVAIKLIFPEALQDSERGNLYRHLLINEAALAGKLIHPHIVQIYDAAIEADRGYIVMEYVPGGTLERYCSPDRLLPLDRLVEIIFKCSRALDYAFRMGITHRDIKPANILLARPDDELAPVGDIKISDFGSALASCSDHTQVSSVGSPAYMSPEQMQDLPLNHQTDIYSLGVVMYQLLSGRLPFESSSSYSLIYLVTHTQAVPPSTFRTEIPPSLDAIVAKAMHRDIDSRYANWDEFSNDLANVFRNCQLSARQQQFPDSEKFETLRSLPFFSEFPDVETWEVVRFSEWKEVPPETAIMQDGETGDFFCFLVTGELIVKKHGRTLTLLSPGECFGEMAVIGKSMHMRGADVSTLATSTIITVHGKALKHASTSCQMHFYQAFLEVLSERLSTANNRLASV